MVRPSGDERTCEACVAGDVRTSVVDGQIVNPGTVDFDHGKSDEAGEWLEPTRHRQVLADIGSEHLVAVEVGVVMPSSPHACGFAGKRGVPTWNRRVELEAQTEVDPEQRRAASDEREIEPGTVPRDQHARREVREGSIGGGQEVGFGAVEDEFEPVATQRQGHDGRPVGVEAVERRVGLDVEADQREWGRVDGSIVGTVSDTGQPRSAFHHPDEESRGPELSRHGEGAVGVGGDAVEHRPFGFVAGDDGDEVAGIDGRDDGSGRRDDHHL